jgi:competence protein ComEC
MIWKYPLIRALFFFVLGLAGSRWMVWDHWELVLGVSCAGIVITRPWRTWVPSWAWWTFGCCVALAFLSLGALRYQQWLHPSESNHYLRCEECVGIQHYAVRTLEDAVNRKRSTAVPVEVLGLRDPNEWKPLSGKAMLTLPAGWADSLRAATILTVWVEWRPIPPPNNPGAFDYQGFLKNRRIFSQGFVRSDDFQIEKTPVGGSQAVAARWRRRAEVKLQEARLSDGSRAMAQALILGQKRDLDRDVMDRFSTTGVIHILAVSGLHVGIVLLMVQLVLNRIPWPYRFRWVPAVLSAVAVWLFALITGLSPSVNRAATMFSFLAVGKVMGRHVPSLHGLLTSAFVLLLLFPGYLFEVGFQLSYAAVAGILLVQPWLALWVQSRWMLVRKAWEMTSVTVAAQLTTFPLGMFYFAKFPFWFIPANWVVLPVLPLVLGAGIVTLLIPTSWLKVLPVDVLLEYLLQWVVGAVDFFNSIDPGWTQRLPMTGLELTFSFAALLLFYQALVRKKYRRLAPAFGVLLVMGLLRLQDQPPEWVVFQVKDNQLFGWSQGDQCLLWAADTTDVEALQRATEGYLKERGLAYRTPKPIESGSLIGPWGKVIVHSSAVVFQEVRMVVMTAPLDDGNFRDPTLDPYKKLNYACVDVHATGGVVVKY